MVEHGRDGVRWGSRVRHFLQELDERLRKSVFVGEPKQSVADITAFVSVEFAGWAKLNAAEDQAHLLRWLEAMRSRPTANASRGVRQERFSPRKFFTSGVPHAKKINLGSLISSFCSIY